MRQPIPTQTWSNVVCGIFFADVRREFGRLPRDRSAVHRQAVHDLLSGDAANRRKQDDVVLRPQVRFLRDRLRADVGERDAAKIERLPPPSFVLRADPGVDDSNAGRASWMTLDAWR